MKHLKHGKLLSLGIVCLLLVIVAPAASAPFGDERPPISWYRERLHAQTCTYTAPDGDAITVKVNGVLVDCRPSATRGNVTAYPTDLTLSPANLTEGPFPASIRADDNDFLELSESCWRYEPSNNTTYCDPGDWTFRWWFEWNGVVPQWTSATATLRVLQAGDTEALRFLIRLWPSGGWATVNIPPFPAQETLYEVTLTAGQWSQYFGSMWTGLEDRFPTDATRTRIRIDEFKVALVTP